MSYNKVKSKIWCRNKGHLFTAEASNLLCYWGFLKPRSAIFFFFIYHLIKWLCNVKGDAQSDKPSQNYPNQQFSSFYVPAHCFGFTAHNEKYSFGSASPLLLTHFQLHYAAVRAQFFLRSCHSNERRVHIELAPRLTASYPTTNISEEDFACSVFFF